MRYLLVLCLFVCCCGDELDPDPTTSENALGETCALDEVVSWGAWHIDCRYSCPALPFDVGLVLESWQQCPLAVCVEQQPDGSWDWCPGSP